MDADVEIVDRSNFELFNALSGALSIELSEPTEAISPKLANQKAPATAAIVSVSFEATVWVEQDGDFRELTEAERALPVFEGKALTLQGLGAPVTFEPPPGGVWTVGDLIAAVEETERRTRGDTEWFDGIDVHHTFFEGIRWTGSAWRIAWGS